MVKIIRLNSIFYIFILASCQSNKEGDVFDWSHPNNMPTYVSVSPNLNNLKRPPAPPQIRLPSLSEVPHYTPTNQPNFIPPPPLFNFVIDFGD